MDNIAIIDYGVHSFTNRLAERLRFDGCPVRYIANGSLESPNLNSLIEWANCDPSLVRVVRCRRPYEKVKLSSRLMGELEWAKNCIAALKEEKPKAVISSCVPLSVAHHVQRWCRANSVLFVYWLQDLQGRATKDLLTRNFGVAGRAIGHIACSIELRMLAKSDFVIIMSPNHTQYLPRRVKQSGSYALLENWANIEEFPLLDTQNGWAVRNGLHTSLNVIYSGTLGLKHDLTAFLQLAQAMKAHERVRVVVVSAGSAADELQRQAAAKGLSNLLVLPFQNHRDVPSVLASATALIAPLDPKAGSFCVPSKILSYLCAGRPIVLSIDPNNSAAQMISDARAGVVTPPGDSTLFLNAVKAYVEQPEIATAAGLAARTFAERTFSMSEVITRFREIMRRANVHLPPVSETGRHLAKASTAGA